MTDDYFRLGVEAAVVDGSLLPGDVAVRDGRVAEIGLACESGACGVALPGFIDLQVNGFAGVDLLTATSPADYEVVGSALAASGVSAYLPTFVTASLESYAAAFAALPRIDAGGAVSAATDIRHRGTVRVLGVHLEGPFLSPLWLGAHNPAHRRDPDLGIAGELLALGPVRVMTLAPELPGALELIDLLLAREVVVWCGHSDASAEVAQRAFDRGARAITHIYNAHRRWQPRDPGLAGAALTHPAVTVQAILDDVHLAPQTATATWRAARERFSLVSDAMAAAGSSASASGLAGQEVAISGGGPRLADGRLAGSLLTMAQAFRSLMRKGATLEQASYAASRAPALLIGRPELGRIAVGAPADLVVLDAQQRVARTLVAGADAYRSPDRGAGS